MGFHLWIDSQYAWAQGTYEYRPMGVAVISCSDLFRPRDFSRTRTAPAAFNNPAYIGQFASIGHMNERLRCRRQKR